MINGQYNSVVQGNRIGLNAAATGPLGNGTGISISNDNNLIGGLSPGEGNEIAFNVGVGINVSVSAGNAVHGNSIHDNGGAALAVSGTTGAETVTVTSDSVSVGASQVVTFSSVPSLAISQSANLVFQLTAVGDVANLQDDPVAANNQSQLVSVNGTFTTTTFVNPTTSLLVNAGAGDDFISIFPLDSLANIPNITIEGVAGDDRFFEAFDGTVTLLGGTGDDVYELHGSTVTVIDDGGSDEYIELFNAPGGLPDAPEYISITDQGGDNDTYSVHGSTVVIVDDGGSDDYSEPFAPPGTAPDLESHISIADFGGDNDTYSVHGSTVVIVDDGGSDDYSEPFAPPGTPADLESHISITDQGGDNDTYSVHGSTVVIVDDGGSDDYSEPFAPPGTPADLESHISITDQGGDNDTYSVHGSTVVIVDDGGSDDYSEPFAPPGTAPDLESHISITDNGGDNDTYSVHGSTVVIVDDGGSDDYSEPFAPPGTEPDPASYISITDRGDDDDTYSVHGSTVVIVDDGGSDDYTQPVPPPGSPPDAESEISITDSGAGDDSYDLHGSHIFVDDRGGSDRYKLNPNEGSIIDLLDAGGFDTIDFSATLGAQISTIEVATDAGNEAYGQASFAGGGIVTIGNPLQPSTTNATILETIIGSANGTNAVTSVRNDETVATTPLFTPQTVVAAGTDNSLTFVTQDNGVETSSVTYRIVGDDLTTDEENATAQIDILANDTLPPGAAISGPTIVNGLPGLATGATCNSVGFDPDGQYEFLAVGESELVLIGCAVTDASGFTAVSALSVTVEGVNDLPQAFSDSGTTSEDSPVTVNVLANDTDPDTSDIPNLKVTAASMISGLGSILISPDGKTVSYDPALPITTLQSVRRRPWNSRTSSVIRMARRLPRR